MNLRSLAVLAAIAATIATAGSARADVKPVALTQPTEQQQAANDAPAAQPQFAPRGEETCLRCHDKGPAALILHTKHAVKGDSRTPFADHQCESCHGASPQHMAKTPDGQKRVPPAVTFGKDSTNTVEERNAVCLNCHQGGNRMNWKGSQHQFANLTCTSCHDMHTLRDPVQKADTQPKVCFECHKEQRSQALKPTHHPIAEGETPCGQCHNPHGSPTPKMLVGNTVNDTCYKCHAEKRGPFLWEHAPVREDCTICHTPHGTVQPRLLETRVPWLCQQCHVTNQHPGGLYSGANLPVNGVGGAQQMLAKGCLNCHSQVHGSNHPSGVRNMR